MPIVVDCIAHIDSHRLSEYEIFVIKILHVIIDFGHIWGPFMAEIEKMCQKKWVFGCPRFWVPLGSS